MADISDRSGPDGDPWLTVQQVSEELKIHPATVRVWIKQGRLQAVRAGKGFRLRRSEVDRALGAETLTTPEPHRSGDGSGPPMTPLPAPRQVADQIIAAAPAVGRET